MTSKKLLTLLIAPLFAVGMSACDVDQTEEGEAPDVEVQEGELPAYDVEGPDVEVTEDTVTVPEVDVGEPNGETQGTTGEAGRTDGTGDIR